MIKTWDDHVCQSALLPASLSGTVYIRVVDTDQTPGNRAKDTLRIDDMGIASVGGTGPTIPAPPSGLIALAISASEVALTWTDNAIDETGFAIERSPNALIWSEIATSGNCDADAL